MLHIPKLFFGWLVGNKTPSKCCLHFCKRKGAFTFKRCQRKYYSIECEENPSNLSEMNLGTDILRCCYWCHTSCSLLHSYCLVSSHNTLSSPIAWQVKTKASSQPKTLLNTISSSEMKQVKINWMKKIVLYLKGFHVGSSFGYWLFGCWLLWVWNTW